MAEPEVHTAPTRRLLDYFESKHQMDKPDRETFRAAPDDLEISG